MKICILIVMALFTNCFVAQSLDTIYVNDKKNVALFFPEPIRQGITGTSNFVFTYNREKDQYFGLLQAMPGTESNLLALTKNGQVYSYILKYKEQLSKLNYFISDKESIGNERSRDIVVLEEQEPKEPDIFFKKFSEALLRSNRGHVLIKRKRGIKIQLQRIAYHGPKTYLVAEITNLSDIDFEVDYLNIYRINDNRRKKTSHQKLLIPADYKHKMPNTIKAGKSNRFVYVLPKFVLGENEKLMFELKELNGSRKIQLLR